MTTVKIGVIGAGASGLLAASMLAKAGAEVTLFERNDRVGKKLSITGKGRCNLTNNCTPAQVLENVVSNQKFLFSAINSFTPSDTMEHFESLGVPLKTERGRRVFPQSDKASSEMDDMSEKYEKLLEERNRKIEKLNNYQIEMASLASAVRSGEENVSRLGAERTQLIAKVASLQELLPKMQSEFEEFSDKADRAALSKEDREELDRIIKQIEELEETKKTLNARTEEVNDERLKTYDDSEKLKEKIHTNQLALQKIDSELENLQTRITEEYNLDYDGCLEFKEEGYDISTSANNISNYKRQLTMLGPVNPNAVEEYEEVSARYNKMCEDKADLEKGIEDLTFALNEIRDEMLKIFNEGFDTINENFKRTFKELFGGGKAELQLDYTDCDDPLNAGVEIVACPPGKKLTKISLLSGGEQALTAIAILFAIIAMRPMPFCVLDEIEAALDEANVGRYARYLKKFAEKTQFIVITHRKPTMENADVLFGVTMEEKGVSKIVSVKISEVESRLGGDTVE